MRELFRQPDFARLLAGRVVTTAGDALYAVASMWLVQELTHSTFYTGLAGTLAFLPYLLQLFVGPLVDRWPIRRTLTLTQGLQGALVLAVPLLALPGRPPLWAILGLIPLLALAGQFGEPAEQAALPRILPPEHLVRANSLFTFAAQGTSLVFRALAGLLVAAVGAVPLYALDALSFLGAAWIFTRLRVPPAPRATAEAAGAGEESGSGAGGETPLRRYLAELGEGLGLVARSVAGRITLGAVALNFVIAAMMVVLPAHAAAHGGPNVYGAMLSAMAAGTIAGALLAPRLERWRISTAIGLVSLAGGAAWLLAALGTLPPLLVGAFGLGWVPGGVVNALVGGGLQRIVPRQLMGRVASAITSLVSLAMPLGSFLGGLAGEAWGPTAVIAGTALVQLLFGLYWQADPVLRRLPATRQLGEEHLFPRPPGSSAAPAAGA